jgi:hypothetical protein
MIKKYITIPKPDYPPTVEETELEINKLLVKRARLLKERDSINEQLFDIKYLLRDLRRNRDRMSGLDKFS